MGKVAPQTDIETAETDEAFVDELKPGTELMHGQYTIDSFLNAGGFGITYNARDSLNRRVVIKECFPGAFCRRSRYLVNARSRAHQNELQSIVRLFVQEAKSLAKLDHPNIVGVHNVFEENNTAYMALDFIEGRDLLDIIEDDTSVLTPEQIDTILRDILSAVGFMHDQGMLHRDISPDNILLDKDMHPVLIDFGAAREQATKQSRVLSALRVVKDGYSPQEFYIQGSDQGPFSDLYALGASFHHMIVGEVPPNSQARLAAIASGQPDPYEPLVGTIPELDDNFLKALDHSLQVLPKDRLQSAAQWLSIMDGKPLEVTAVAPADAGTPTATSNDLAGSVTGSGKTKMLVSTAILALLAGGFMITQSGILDSADEPVAPAVAADATTDAGTTVSDESADASAVVTDAVADPVSDDAAEADPVVADGGEIAVPAEESEPVTADVAVPDTETAEGTPVESEDSVAVAEVSDTTPPFAAADLIETAELPDLFIGSGPTLGGADLSFVDVPIAFPTTLSAAVAPDDAPVITDAPEALAAPAQEVSQDPDSATQEPEVAEVAPPTALETPGPAGPIASVPTVVVPYAGLFDAAENETRIFSAEGQPVNTQAEFDAAILATQDLSAATEVTVLVETGVVGQDNAREQSLTLPVAQNIRLANGVTFRAALIGDAWETTVVAVPSGVDTDLMVGDVVFAYVPTTELINDRRTLEAVFQRELESGTSEFSFAVMRDGATWVASLVFEAS